MTQTLRSCLSSYPRIMLEAIADGWSISLTDEQLPEIVDRLSAEMSHPASVRLVLGRLSQAEREALAYAVAIGQVKAHVMTRRYGQIRQLGPGSLEWQQAWRAPISPLERLWFLGLVCARYAREGSYHGQVFVVPGELRDALPPMAVDAPESAMAEVAPPTFVRDDGDALARDAFVLLCYVRNNTVKGKSAPPSAKDLTQLRERLSHGRDAPRLSFLRHLCQQAGLIGRGVDSAWKPLSAAVSWLKAGAHARKAALFRAWFDDVNCNELCLLPGVRCEGAGWHSDPILARKGALNQLSHCTPGVWYSIDSFTASIYALDPDFLRPDGDYDSWYIRDVETGTYLSGFGNWERVEGRLLRFLLEGPFLWLGATACGYAAKGEGASSFLLTRIGAALLGLIECTDGPLASISVDAALRVAVPSSTSWYDRFILERLARWVGEDADASRYVIDRLSFRAAQSVGVTLRQATAFLRRASTRRLPPRALSLLSAWDAQLRAEPATSAGARPPVDRPTRSET